VLEIGTAITIVAGILAWIVDTWAPSIAGFVATWSLYAVGIAFALPGAFATVLASARREAGLAAGILGAGQMLSGAVGSALPGLIPGVPTAVLGATAACGGIVAAGGYALSRTRRAVEPA
jgi:MFS family permease